MRYELTDFEWAAIKPFLPITYKIFRTFRIDGFFIQ